MRRTASLAAALLAVIPIGGPADAQARTEANVLMPTDERARADGERYGYAEAVIAGDLIFLSGLVAGLAPGETDLKAAYERLYRHVGTILKRAGADYGDIVDVTSFHTDIKAQIDAMSEVQKKYLKSPPPAWTAIDIDRLLPEGGMTEIKIVARRPAGGQRASGN